MESMIRGVLRECASGLTHLKSITLRSMFSLEAVTVHA